MFGAMPTRSTLPTMTVLGLLLAVTLLAAFTDARARRIPNLLTLGALVTGPLLHALFAPGARGLEAAEWSVASALLCAAGPLLFFRLGWMGGGDVKLVAAMGAVGGIELGLEAAFLSFFLLVAFASLVHAWRGTLGRSFVTEASRLWRQEGEEVCPPVRFGPFACAGAAMTTVLHGGGLFG